MLPLLEQWMELATLALVVSCVSWTITHEEVFREVREWFGERSRSCPTILQRKFCYVFTCEYCFSHYVAAVVVAGLDWKLLASDWRGWILAWFALVAVANVYMSIYARVRVEIGTGKAQLREAEQSARRAG